MTQHFALHERRTAFACARGPFMTTSLGNRSRMLRCTSASVNMQTSAPRPVQDGRYLFCEMENKKAMHHMFIPLRQWADLQIKASLKKKRPFVRQSFQQGSGGRTWTCDLRVMSPTSCHCSTPQRSPQNIPDLENCVKQTQVNRSAIMQNNLKNLKQIYSSQFYRFHGKNVER